MIFKDTYEQAAREVLHGGIQKYESDLDDFLKQKKASFVADS